MARKTFEKDKMGGHARLYEQICHSAAWLALSFSARALYVQVRLKLKQTNNGNINATQAELKHAGFGSSSTLAKALRELETVGLIQKTRQGGITYGGKLCNLFRFTDQPTFDFPKLGLTAMPASNEWEHWEAIRHATAAIREAHAAAKRPKSVGDRIVDLKPKISKRSGSNVEADGRNTDSKSGHDADSSVHKSKLRLVG